MRNGKLSIVLPSAQAILAVILLVTVTRAAGQQETILHSFGNNGKDGTGPTATLVFDTAGNLYGTTTSGGANQLGTVFELSPKAGGGWTENVLHTFPVSLKDGDTPAAPVIFDSSGNLYGTTSGGGAYDAGTVFELTHSARGWRETVLHDFNPNIKDGSVPYAGLLFDAAGNLYGATSSGGAYGQGTVFELSHKSPGVWKETLLHSFGNGTDGFGPTGLIFDTAGNLYGTTWSGGAYGAGTVFQMTPTAGGGWMESVLYSFLNNGVDGYGPNAGVIFDAVGNLYGTTFYGGTDGIGTVFELSPAAGGWTEHLLYTFINNHTDGVYPTSGVIFDQSGNLCGATEFGGSKGSGNVFELTPTGGGAWAETILHAFVSSKDGVYPNGLVLDSSGNLYGTTTFGGAYGYGTVFKITP